MRLLLFGCMMILWGGIMGQNAPALSLDEALKSAVDKSYLLQVADQNFEVARLNNSWGAAGRLPSVNMFLNLDNGLTNQANPASFLRELQSLSNGFTPGIEGSWTIWAGNRIPLTKEQLNVRENLSANQVEQTRENVTRTVVLAYYQVLILQEQVGVLEEVLSLSRDRLAYEEVREEFGQAGTFDLLQVKDAWLNDSIALIQQRTALDRAHRNLNLAIGLDDPSVRHTLTTPLEFAPEQYAFEDLQQMLFSNNKELRGTQINRELARINTRLQETQRKPVISVSAGGNYNYNVSNGEGVFASGDLLDLNNIEATRINYFLNIGAAYNLYNGETRKRAIQAAQVSEVVSQYQVEDLRRQLSTELANVLADYKNQVQTFSLTETLLESARRNMQLAEERFRGGLINSFDYRSIQLAFINASQSRLNALFELKTIEIQLLQLVGELG
ncbi:MAG: TolC family protein [Saprospiraceae bacterium]